MQNLFFYKGMNKTREFSPRVKENATVSEILRFYGKTIFVPEITLKLKNNKSKTVTIP
jgi:hypothetical protein